MNTSAQHTEKPDSVAMETSETPDSRQSTWKRIISSMISLTVAVAVLLCGVLIIQNRAVATSPLDDKARVTVQTITIERTSSFDVERRFVGLMESNQNIDIAFESGGKLSEILVQEGDEVLSGSTLAILDQSSLKAQRQQILALRQASALGLKRADLALQRERELSVSGFRTEESLDNARLSVEDATARIIQVEAQLREIDILLSKATLKAPYNAIVGERLFDPGSFVAAGQPVLRLFEQRNPTARIGIPADLNSDWSAKKNSRITVNGEEFDARYVGRRPDVAPGTRVIETRFELLDNGNEWPAVGEMAQLLWVDTQFASGYWVPVSALSEGKRGLWSVLRLSVEEDSGTEGDASNDELATVIREHVEVLHTDGNRAYVQASMPDSVRIVFNGSHRVVPQQRVLLAQFAK
ncbi:MAG: efflux RND transporter periplasmic adaptor subunit [Granulosicoccus sp.]